MRELVLLDHVAWVHGRRLLSPPGKDLIEPAKPPWTATNAIPFRHRQARMIREWDIRHRDPEC